MPTTLINYKAESRDQNWPLLAPAERVIWIGMPNRLEYFLYWVPRALFPFSLWTISWIYVLKQQYLININLLSIYIPIAFIIIGVTLMLMVPISAIMARRFTYLVTSQRIIIYNKVRNRSRFLYRRDAGHRRLTRGWSDFHGSIALEAGTVATPDGPAMIKLLIVGVNNINDLLNSLE